VTDFRVPDVRFSDHRPLVCDFHVPPDALVRRSAPDGFSGALRAATRSGFAVFRNPQKSCAQRMKECLMNESAAWKVERDADDVVWLTIDKPGTSAMCCPVRAQGARCLLQPLTKNPPRALAVISGKKKRFVAGADIKEFTGITNAEEGYR